MYCKQYNTMKRTICVYVNTMKIHIVSALLITITGIHNLFCFLFDFLIDWENFPH